MKYLNKIKDMYQRLDMSPEAALEEIFNTYIPNKEYIKESGFTLSEFGYGIWQLRKPSKDEKDYTFEGSYTECCEKFRELTKDY